MVVVTPMYSPKFIISPKLLKDIGTVEGARAVIDGAALLPAWEAKFQEDAEVRAVHYGTHVEGNELNLDEVRKLMEGKEIVARDRDIKEVINYRKVLDYLDKIIGGGVIDSAKRRKLYTEDTLK